MSKIFTEQLLKAEIKNIGNKIKTLTHHGSNLILKIYPSGRATYFYRRMVNGKLLISKIANYNSMTIKQALEFTYLQNAIRHNEKIIKVHLEELNNQKFVNEKNSNIILKNLIVDELANIKKNKRKNTYMLYKYVVKYFNHDLFVTDVRQLDINSYINFFRQHINISNQYFTIIDLLITKCNKKCLINHNFKFEQIKLKELILETKEQKTQSRVDEHHTFKMIDAVLNNVEIKETVKLMFLYQLFTMSRPQETYNAKIKEIDSDYWIIPKERMKCHQDHIVPITLPLKKLINVILKTTANKTNLFPKIGRQKSFDLSIYNMKRQTWHGLRGVASTWLNNHKQPSHIVEMLLAHKINGIASRYDNSNRINERKDVLNFWHNSILDNTVVNHFLDNLSS